MKSKEISIKDLSAYLNYLITEFYSDNLQPFYDAIDEDVIWVGPLHNQYLHGKDAAIRAFGAESGHISYTIGPIVTELIPHGRSQCDTVSFFSRKASYDDGRIIDINLCFHLSWIKKDTWYMSVISIMVRPVGDERDKVYPLHPPAAASTLGEIGEKETDRIMLREKASGSALLIAPQSILWAESAGHYSIVHIIDAEFTVTASLSRLDELTGGVLLRCHSGYLINPHFVRSITRFHITLADGSTVPVPEKKYTSVKARLTEVMDQ